MPLDIIVSTQWGDDDSEQIGEYIASGADYVARFNGGDFVGRPVSVGDQTFRLHLIPASVIDPQITAVLGNGLVLNPKVLINDLAKLHSAGIEITPERLLISHAAHLITPAYLALDRAREQARGEKPVITPFRGIGPAYNHKTARSGLRMEDVLSIDSFAREIQNQIESANDVLTDLYEMNPIDAKSITREYVDAAYQLTPFITNVSAHLSKAMISGSKILALGVQGTLVDLDHGVYPSVSNSTTVAAGALVGLGIGVGSTDRVIGVSKAYQSYAGDGPFPTEVVNVILGKHHGNGKKPGKQQGSTPGRPRRFGWLDGVLLRDAIQVNGITELALTDLSALSGLSNLRICTAYQDGGEVFNSLPLGPTNLHFEPVYVELPGWDREILHVRKWRQLPREAQSFVHSIEELANVPIHLISVGPEQDQIIEVA